MSIPPPLQADGLGCHAGKDKMRAAAEAAGMSETLGQYAKDYPQGPHDQPQSMCPAFGSLRVGLRMRRTAMVLSGSACCVYGLTFTSHFYGAKRTVGYVPFNSETLVTGKLFEDIREAVYQLADPANYDAVVIINLCVPTASGVPLRLLPKEINGVRIIGIDVPGFGVPTHAEAKDVLAGAMLRFARLEAEEGPVQAPRAPRAEKPSVSLLGRDVPRRSDADRRDARSSRPRRRSRHADARMARTLWRAGLRGRRGDPSFLHCLRARVRSRRGAASSAPRLSAMTARRPGWKTSAPPAMSEAPSSTPRRRVCCLRSRARCRRRRSRAASRFRAMKVRSFWSDDCSSSPGPICAMSARRCPRTRFSDADREWLEAKGVHVQFRASLEQDFAAFDEFRPDLAIGTTPVVQKAKQSATPALYFTNLISARPLMGVAGAGSLAKVVNTAIGNQSRFDVMNDFFAGVGEGYAAGVWQDIPRDRPEFRKKHAAKMARKPAEEMGSC